MLRKDDLGALIAATPSEAVSIYLPTHQAGPEIRQDPIRLRNLLDEAKGQLSETGLREADVQEILAPARALTDDYDFWRHQQRGLALFLAPDFFQCHRLPIEVTERVTVSERFDVKPLLPAFAENGRFFVLAATKGRVRLFEGSRHGMTERQDPEIPKSIAGIYAETEYEETAHANPLARPHTRMPTEVPSAQNFGESAEELRKTELIEFVRRLSAAVAVYLGDDQAPLVLAAEPEIAGHFRQLYGQKNLFPKGVAINPEALDEAELHQRAYALLQPEFSTARDAAIDQFMSLAGNGDERATTSVEDVVKAARFGQVDTLFVDGGAQLWGRFDDGSENVVVHEGHETDDIDLLDYAAAQTLLQGGRVHLMDRDSLPQGGCAAAILRWGRPNP